MDKIINQKDIMLFVDDEKICHSLIELIIPNFTNFKLVNAYDGTEALDLAKRYRNRLCLILSDIMLPGIDGYEIYRQLRQDDKYKDVPFIFQSGLSAQEPKLKELDGGVKIIYKPYNQAELLRIISETVPQSEFLKK